MKIPKQLFQCYIHLKAGISIILSQCDDDLEKHSRKQSVLVAHCVPLYFLHQHRPLLLQAGKPQCVGLLQGARGGAGEGGTLETSVRLHQAGRAGHRSREV